MSKKRAVTGLRGLALAPVTTDSATAYECGEATELPFAGSLSRTQKESKTDLYYDDELYAQVRAVAGEEVEIRVAEVPLSRMAALGLGTYNSTTNTLEADFSITGQSYALRFVTDTVDGLPYYFNYRLFELSGIRFDNFSTRKENANVCEIVLSGVLRRPRLASLCAWSAMELLEDRSNAAACATFLTAAESKA